MSRVRALARRRAADLVLAVLLAWATWGWAAEVRTAQRGWHDRATYRAPPADWRFGALATQRLRHCVARMAPWVPAGASLWLFDPRQEFFRWRWAAYFAVDRTVLPPAADYPPGAWVLSLAPRAPPRGERLMGDPACGLYRWR